MEVRHSVCALDCPDACGLLINVESGRGSKLRGIPEHAVTRGFLCGKVAQYLEREYHPDRLLHPMKRAGAKGEGRFTRISWSEALDTIAERLTSIAAQHGPESILPHSYAGTMGLLNNAAMDRRFFHRLGASRLDRTICSSAGGAGLIEALGYKLGTEPEQFAHSKLILAWGANILGTNVHLWPFIVEARRNGARFYTIDPVRNRTGKTADKHFFINPGSDLALALGLMHVIFRERLEDTGYLSAHAEDTTALRALAAEYTPAHAEQLTGIPAADIVSLALDYATTKPACIRFNYGLQRSERGGRAFRAIACLPAITGSWKDIGGGAQASTSGAFAFNRAAAEMPELQLASPLGREARLVNMSRLGLALTELDSPRIHALVNYNSNPAAITPDSNRLKRGLRRDDLFTVVLEQFQTDTADYADIVLPSTTFLEHTDLYLAYGHYYLQMARPALPAPGECKSNFEVFRLLAERMGFTEPCFQDTEDDVIRALLNSGHEYFRGITLERLEREHHIRLNVSEPGTPFQPFKNGGFGTPSGKAEFGADVLRYVPPIESRHGDASINLRYPLELISAKNDDSMNSTLGHRDEVDAQTAVAELHSADAAARGIASGDSVRLFNDRGSVLLSARVNGSVHRGVVRVPSVRWGKRSIDGNGINVLTSDRLTDIGAGATFYNCLIEVERCGD